jgi:hypothetical protein
MMAIARNTICFWYKWDAEAAARRGRSTEIN